MVILAAAGARTPRDMLALLVAVGGVAALTNIRIVNEPLGFVFAFANCALFMLYVVLGHKIANTKIGNARNDTESSALAGIDQLGAGMLIAAVVATPFGIWGPAALVHPTWLLWGIVVGLCSSVIPYVTDQLAMARLPRATFALMLRHPAGYRDGDRPAGPWPSPHCARSSRHRTSDHRRGPASRSQKPC